MTKQTSPKLKLALTIIQAILLGLALVTTCFAVAFAVSFLSIEDAATDSTTSEQIGVGLSRAFSAVFFVISAIATAILTIPGEILAIWLARKTEGGKKIFGVCSIVAYAVFVLVCGVFWIFVI